MRTLRHTCLLLLVLLQAATAETTDCGKAKPTPKTIQSALACLAAQDWVQEDLRELGIKPGHTVSVRYGHGTIPGTSPEDPESLNIVVYSADGRKAWLLFARAGNAGEVVAVRNAYRLMRSRTGWAAGEGNGGIAMYRAVARYVEGLGKQPALNLPLATRSESCRTED